MEEPKPMDLDGVPPCGSCGGTLEETEHPAEPHDADGSTGYPPFWSYRCTDRECGHEYGNNGEITEPMTCRNAPWTRAVAAEADRVREVMRYAVALVMDPALQLDTSGDAADSLRKRYPRDVEDACTEHTLEDLAGLVGGEAWIRRPDEACCPRCGQDVWVTTAALLVGRLGAPMAMCAGCGRWGEAIADGVTWPDAFGYEDGHPRMHQGAMDVWRARWKPAP